MILYRVTKGLPTSPDYLFRCPGCRITHGIWVTHPNNYTGDIWKFNGDFQKPTFSPSILVNTDRLNKPTRCHSFIRDGMIEFCADSTHKLSGQTVPLPDW